MPEVALLSLRSLLRTSQHGHKQRPTGAALWCALGSGALCGETVLSPRIKGGAGRGSELLLACRGSVDRRRQPEETKVR